jgi:phosphoribosylaminoimidazolecarboxamide formyltransferase/IMP cyclohydrolase
MIKRALLSVYDKDGIVEFAKGLEKNDIEIISSGGTYRLLKDNDVMVKKISEVTNSKEILDGRVKTLHPKIHGGILALRNNEDHMKTLKEEGIVPIDMVVCNLYPFESVIKKDNTTLEVALENIDIGGPSMIRSAAKNFNNCLVVTDKNDYELVIKQIEADNIAPEFRKKLALKAFSQTAYYDSIISNYLREETLPEILTAAAKIDKKLRYGENPHQKAASYSTNQVKTSILNAKKLQGKDLSYNNINDADAALRMILEYSEPTAIAVKHTNPCGAGSADDILTAYKKAHDADPVSIFGGIVALNRPINEELAKELTKIFLDVIIAPKVTEKGKAILASKKNTRVLEVEMDDYNQPLEIKSILGGFLVQENDNINIDEEAWEVVAGENLSEKDLSDVKFAWKLIKHVKSNAIIVVKDLATLGVGCGQVNRIDAAKYALNSGADKCSGGVLASDGLFPFDDVVKEAAKYGIKTIVQPGGSIRDQESIDAAAENGITMIFTKTRHFKH